MLKGIRFSGAQDGSFAECVSIIQVDMNLACIPKDMDDASPYVSRYGYNRFLWS